MLLEIRTSRRGRCGQRRAIDCKQEPVWAWTPINVTRVFLDDITPRHAHGWCTRWPRWTVRPRGLAMLVRRCTRSQNVPRVDQGNGPELLRRACEIRRSAFSWSQIQFEKID